MFEIGKTYLTRDNSLRKVVAFAEDGRMIVESSDGVLAYRDKKGKCLYKNLGSFDLFDLVDPNPPVTPEE